MTTCTRGLDALTLLREASPPFHLVLSDVYMPDMDGYRLLERLGLEMEVPVISTRQPGLTGPGEPRPARRHLRPRLTRAPPSVMSADGETSSVLRGMLHGAVDYLQKPIQMSDLRYIWQHVIRRDRAAEQPAEGKGRASGGGGAGQRVGKEKRSKAAAEGEEEERVVWAMELHGRFVEAVNVLGVDKAVPKRILELMGVHGLTRENVASHLQKYRLVSDAGGCAGGSGSTPAHSLPPLQYLKRVQTLQSEQRAAERRATGSMARGTVSPPQHVAPSYPHGYGGQGGGFGFAPAPVEPHFWTPMDAFDGALRKFDSSLGADLAPFAAGSMPPPPEDPAAHAAVAQLDFSIGNGLSIRGLGGSMTGLDTLAPPAEVSEDALLQQFLHAALSPGEGGSLL